MSKSELGLLKASLTDPGKPVADKKLTVRETADDETEEEHELFVDGEGEVSMASGKRRPLLQRLEECVQRRAAEPRLYSKMNSDLEKARKHFDKIKEDARKIKAGEMKLRNKPKPTTTATTAIGKKRSSGTPASQKAKTDQNSKDAKTLLNDRDEVLGELEKMKEFAKKILESCCCEVVKTSSSSGTLGNNLRSGVGGPQDVTPEKVSNFPEAHHLVEGERSSVMAANSRDVLYTVCININDAINGIWLPKTSNSSKNWLNRTFHNETFRDGYDAFVAGRLPDPNDSKLKRTTVERALGELFAHLASGQSDW